MGAFNDPCIVPAKWPFRGYTPCSETPVEALGRDVLFGRAGSGNQFGGSGRVSRFRMELKGAEQIGGFHSHGGITIAIVI